MTKSEFDHLLKLAGGIARDRDFYLIGSQAPRGVCSRIPRDFPQTFEADLYPRRHPQAWPLLRRQLGRASKFFRQHGDYLDCTDPGLAPLPEGWTERLIPYRTPRTDGVTAWCLEPHDLFVSKLAAGRKKDRLFLRAMLRHKLARVPLAARRIEDLPMSSEERAQLIEPLRQIVADLHANQKSAKPEK
jgi:hypothetical protein